MEMIIGGACQGKRRYVENKYSDVTWVSGETCCREELLKAEGIDGFHLFIRKEIREGRETSDLAAELIKNNPSVILISDEVGYGVVPMDAFERKYREAVGRVCTELASFSSRVTRVVCGIGTVIKDA